MRSASDELIGTLIGNYRFVEKIGEGGMGVLYRAEHVDPHVRLFRAIKVMRETVSHEEAHKDFVREAAGLAEVEHPRLVHIVDFGTLADGRPYLAMEFVRGVTLGRYLSTKGTLSALQACELGAQVAEALQSVHAHGLVHCDVTTSNVMLETGVVNPIEISCKLLDLGIAVRAGEPESSSGRKRCPGTSRFMSPEQWNASVALTFSVDTYSLGLVVFESLTGRSPYDLLQDASRMDWMLAHTAAPQRLLSEFRNDVPQSLSAWIGTLLDRTPSQRPTALQVARKFQTFADKLRKETEPPKTGRDTATQTDASSAIGAGSLSPVQTGMMRRAVQTFSVHPLRNIAILLGILAGVSVGMWKRKATPKTPILAQRALHAPPGMVYVPERTFRMGSTPEQIERAISDCPQYITNCKREWFEQEGPVRLVTVSEFYMDRTEVTSEAFYQFMSGIAHELRFEKRGYNGFDVLRDWRGDVLYILGFTSPIYMDRGQTTLSGLRLDEKMPKLPIQTTWIGAYRFCRFYGKTLPSEAQWEAAARHRPTQPGEPDGLYPWGNDPPLCEGVVMHQVAEEDFTFGIVKKSMCKSTHPGPSPVGTSSQDRTASGILDLAGNVGEWVLDRYSMRYPLCEEPCLNPVFEPEPSHDPTQQRIFRGSSYERTPLDARATARMKSPEQTEQLGIGFRCVLSIKPPTQNNQRP